MWGGRLYLWDLAHVGDLKKQCETVLGVVSQCCLTKHVFKMTKQYLANVALKINVKVYWVLLVIKLCVKSEVLKHFICSKEFVHSFLVGLSFYARLGVATLFLWMH